VTELHICGTENEVTLQRTAEGNGRIRKCCHEMTWNGKLEGSN